MKQNQYTLNDLLAIMARLRDPETGCPWDKAQTFRTIAPYTLEEAYEVVDTIERDDMAHLKEELGDLLFQVVYHAQMASELEQGAFDFSSVVQKLAEKLVRRHPHIFPNGSLTQTDTPELTADEVREAWQNIKAQEKEQKENASLLDGISNNLPALVIAQKLQDKAARVNFDWPDVRPVIAKLKEEITEIEEAIEQGDQDAVASEVGDFLFAATNMARHLKVDAEQSVRGCNQKFRKRFAFIEQAVLAQGKEMKDCTLEELDRFWDKAKEAGF
ncbi:nucleoside triphosphate pyrophosphohydrolase [Sansalvadorimonas verongulae]|uniref:nucleoside triphosphate pyrophosphohydrolase n=1 Tax=Sansalvadorimonas verongulae TaxID=2172824 RepID=UPI0012BD1531|nr:nucleoside triphosphate pyrophosphohydrolase [Sansalvadorimonas verongulae]MTI15171.1 nucleoside triphosphate pyrophosphohydrolase [Sansalvadorimonas verongulae]